MSESSKTFEIEHYLTEIKVGPYRTHKPLILDSSYKILNCMGDTRNYEGEESRPVYTQSKGKLLRRVKFAADNQRRRKFEIRYRTLNEGAIVVRHNVRNEVHGKYLNAFYQNAVEYRLEFTPRSKKPWPELDLDIYKGFDRGSRDAHFHLDDPGKEYDVERHYRRMTYVLDLSDYQKEGKRIPPFRANVNKEPRLWHVPEDRGHRCKGRAAYILGDPEVLEDYFIDPDAQLSKPKEWKWTWKLEDVTGGTIDIIWEDFLIPPYDVFVSHASEDKEMCADPLVDRLTEAGLRVWYDKNEMRIRDHLMQNIVRGIGFSRMGVVILSPSFFKRDKTWTKEELEIMSSLEGESKFVLPVLYDMTVEELRKEDSGLADVLLAKWEDGENYVVQAIVNEAKRLQTDL